MTTIDDLELTYWILLLNNSSINSTNDPIINLPTKSNDPIINLSTKPNDPIINLPTKPNNDKKSRVLKTDYQLYILETFFETNMYPSNNDLEYIANDTNLSYKTIKIWFQNRRARRRKNWTVRYKKNRRVKHKKNKRHRKNMGVRYRKNRRIEYKTVLFT